MSNLTAKVVVTGHTKAGDDQMTVGFIPDYADGRNKEWAKYTPSLSLVMTVKAEVAERLPVGQAFTLTFTSEG